MGYWRVAWLGARGVECVFGFPCFLRFVVVSWEGLLVLFRLDIARDLLLELWYFVEDDGVGGWDGGWGMMK